tara:strand:- start:375 stop:1424 length:1050 start_codon:yes stop_codon:yes gene_type:complete
MMTLADKQKTWLRENYQVTTDLIELTRQLFMDDKLDGRTKEGRAVRKFLIDEGLNYNTTQKDIHVVELTEGQKDFVVEYAKDGMTAFQIASLLFPEVNMTPLSKEMLVVNDYLKSHAPSFVKAEESSAGDRYSAPTTPLSVARKINRYTSEDLKVERLTLKEKNCVEALASFLQAPRFNVVINNYNAHEDRMLFEAEFVRATWDKPDLSADEINLYINVCVDYINLKNISAHVEKLNRMFNEAEEQQDMSIRLAELLKTKSEEYNQCEKRMESLIMRLSGDRAKRVANKHQENASLINLVQLFQDEEERKVMVRIAELQKRAVKERADEFEKMPEWKSRVLGITKGEIT